MALQTRNSALAIKKEVTEGVPVKPVASGDFIPLQDDFSMSPSFNVLENAELKASIGTAKPILGAENPTATFSAYVKSSGTEAQEPGYGEILEAAYGGVRTLSQRLTVDSSTTTVTSFETNNVEDSGLQVGDAVILVDAVNGYQIRNVAFIDSDDVTWDFALPAAPASGVEATRSVNYFAAQSGQTTLSLWHYVANQGAIQLMSGTRPTSVAITIDAGELINANYSFEGLEYFFNPIEITASNKFIDFTDDDGTFAVSVPEQYYKDPNDLASAMTAAMNGSASTQTHLVTYINQGTNACRFQIENTTGATLSLLWNSGANNANTIASTIGFSDGADDTGATSYLGDNQLDLTSEFQPAFDPADPLAAKDNEFFIGDADQNVCVDASSITWNVDLTKVNVQSVCAKSGISESIYSERAVPITATILLEKGDADKFNKFQKNDEVQLAYHYGTRVGGNWEIGKSGSLYVPKATITSHDVGDEDGVVVFNLEFSAFVDDQGSSEVFQSFL